MQILLRMFVLISIVSLMSCVSTAGSQSQRRAVVQTMKTDVLSQLFSLKPDVRGQINEAAGYAVFSNANINIFLASFGGGYGVLTDNSNAQDVYMKMGEIGVGLGLGVKDFRIVMVFHTNDALDRFQEYGFSIGAQADAAAIAGEQGAAIGGEVTADNVTLYQITENGLALQATIKGTRFWRDEELN